MRSRYRLAAILSQVHGFIYVVFGGRFLTRKGSARFLLLTTVGRRSKQSRTVPLLYVTSRESLAVIGSFGGNQKAPAWLLNLRENSPENSRVKVQVGRVRWQAIARIATEEERLELWPRFVEIFPGYEGYRSRTTRVFPIVLLTPLEE